MTLSVSVGLSIKTGEHEDCCVVQSASSWSLSRFVIFNIIKFQVWFNITFRIKFNADMVVFFFVSFNLLVLELLSKQISLVFTGFYSVSVCSFDSLWVALSSVEAEPFAFFCLLFHGLQPDEDTKNAQQHHVQPIGTFKFLKRLRGDCYNISVFLVIPVHCRSPVWER